MAYNPILMLRPTNVVHQLEPTCPLPLLSGRLCLSALAQSNMILWVPMVNHPGALRAVVRAAAHLKAVIGLCFAPTNADTLEFKRTGNPAAFFRAAAEAAADLNYHVPPFFLHVQEPPVAQTQTPAFEAVRKHLSASFDCGFTSFGVDLSACAETELIPVISGLLGQILEFELAVVVRLPSVSATGTNLPARYEQTLNTLVRAGIKPDLVLLPGRFDGFGLSQHRTLAMTIAPTGIACNEIQASAATSSLISAGLRAVLGDARLTRLVDRHAHDPDRLEALAYLEATDWIERLGGRGSADRLIAHMSGMVHQ